MSDATAAVNTAANTTDDLLDGGNTNPRLTLTLTITVYATIVKS